MMTFISFLVLLGLLIFIHEMGHLLAAKLVGVKVERFSLGFPPKLFSKKIGETEYQVALVPLGGYVKLFGENPDEEIDPAEIGRSFSHKPPWAKSVVVLAGPAFNLVFAVLMFWALTFFVGIEHLAPRLGPVAEQSAGQAAGLKMDDVVLSINGSPVAYYDQIDSALENSQGRNLEFLVERDGQQLKLTVTPTKKEGKNVFGEPIDIYSAGLRPRSLPVIGGVLDGRAAEKAGIQAGDEIIAIEGQPVKDWSQVTALIRGKTTYREEDGKPVAFPLVIKIKRGAEVMEISVAPELVPNLTLEGKTEYIPQIGIEHKLVTVNEPVGFFRAMKIGFTDSWDMVAMIGKSVQKLFTGQVSAKTLGGPILIAEISGQKANDGLLPFLNLAAFISINLGILNLLPIPMLDGGQFTFFMIEAVRRKRLSDRFREITAWVGAGLLGLLMVLVFYNDIARLVERWRGPSADQVKISAPAQPAAATGGEEGQANE